MLTTFIKIIIVVVLSIMAFKLIMRIPNLSEEREKFFKLLMALLAIFSSAIVIKVDNVNIDFNFGGKTDVEDISVGDNSPDPIDNTVNTSEDDVREMKEQSEPSMEEILNELRSNGTPFCNLNVFAHELGLQTLDEKGNLLQEIGKPIEKNLCLELKMKKKDDPRINYDKTLYTEYDAEFKEGIYTLHDIPVGLYEYVAKVNGYQNLVEEIDIKSSLISGNAFFTNLNFEANDAKEFAPYTLNVVDGNFQQLLPELVMVDYDGTIMQEIRTGIDGVIRLRAQLGENLNFSITYGGREYRGTITLEKRGEEYYLQLQNDGTVAIKDYEDYLNK